MKEEKTVGQITVEKNVGGIEGLCVITPAVHGDARGYFMETYNEREMKEAGFDIQFVQDNPDFEARIVNFEFLFLSLRSYRHLSFIYGQTD